MPGLQHTVRIAAPPVAGPMGRVGWLMTKRLTKRYVETEAASIKRVTEEGPKSS